MISGPPLRPGSVQVAVRVVDEPETADTVGLAGVSGCSFAFITVTVMVSVAICSRSPVPLVACTSTT